jgi:hypothetical protein
MESQKDKLDENQIDLVKMKQSLNLRIKNGILWFYGIAGLSILLSIIYLLRITDKISGVLGTAQLVNKIFPSIATDYSSIGGVGGRFVVFSVTLMISLIFVVIGVIGRRNHRWLIVIGIILYGLDALINIFTYDLTGIAFHAIALWGLFSGLNAMDNLKMLEKGEKISIPIVESDAAIEKRKTSLLLHITAIIFIPIIISIVFFLLLYLFLLKLIS